MKDESVVKIIAEYLASVKEEADMEHPLVQLIHFVDYKYRCIPTLEEVLCGIQMVNGINVIKKDRLIYFDDTPALEGQVETITEEDLQYAYKQYTTGFRNSYREMATKRKKGSK